MSTTKPDQAAAVDPIAEISVRSLLIPLSGMTLILPNTAVAEVADYQPPHRSPDAPGWLLGIMPWRGRSVPLLAFEHFVGLSPGVGGVHARAVICNTLNGNAHMPFIAVLAQGIPRLQEVKAEALEEVEKGEGDAMAVAARVRIAGQEGVIPDLDVLERLLSQLGIKAG